MLVRWWDNFISANYYIEAIILKSLIMNMIGESTLEKLKNILKVENDRDNTINNNGF
jgi:hypothetical protein